MEMSEESRPMLSDLTSRPVRHSVRRVFAALVLSVGLALAARAAAPVRPNEIIVSAANYAEASPDVLNKMFHHPVDVVDATPPPASNRPVRYYQFLASEPLKADLSYDEVCKLL